MSKPRVYPRRPFPTSPASRFLRALSVAAWASLVWDTTRWWLWLAAALLAYAAAFLVEVRLRETQVDPVDVAALALEQYAYERRLGLAGDPLTREEARVRAADANNLLERDLHRWDA